MTKAILYPLLFAGSILLFTVHASIYQIALTDTDKKEILSILFEHDPSAAPKEILLSPRTDANWVLELPGIRFRQLSYVEEKETSEYYELRDVKVHRDYVELWLSKGNYCKKIDTGYQFRKEGSQWKAKITQGGESFTASGTTCAGCKIDSGIKRQATPSTPQDLRLTGKATGISCQRSEVKYVRCNVDLSLDFINQGNQPIIILQPHGEYEFWQGGRSLALTKADSEANNYVYSSAAWPSIYDTEEYRLLAERLDQPTPPANLTRVLAPGESWAWNTKIQLALAEENACSGSTGVEIGWKEIRKLTAPVWLEVSYEMWPFNVENFKKDLGGQLRERWKRYGILYLEEKSTRFWFAHLTSEPIELDFRQVEDGT